MDDPRKGEFHRSKSRGVLFTSLPPTHLTFVLSNLGHSLLFCYILFRTCPTTIVVWTYQEVRPRLSEGQSQKNSYLKLKICRVKEAVQFCIYVCVFKLVYRFSTVQLLVLHVLTFFEHLSKE